MNRAWRAVAILPALMPASSLAVECSLDQVVFQDARTGRQFTAERVAVNHSYLCGKRVIRSTRLRKDLNNCRGPYGETIIEGWISGARVFAIYTVEPAAPCCSWDSYSDRSSRSSRWRRNGFHQDKHPA